MGDADELCNENGMITTTQLATSVRARNDTDADAGADWADAGVNGTTPAAAAADDDGNGNDDDGNVVVVDDDDDCLGVADGVSTPCRSVAWDVQEFACWPPCRLRRLPASLAQWRDLRRLSFNGNRGVGVLDAGVLPPFHNATYVGLSLMGLHSIQPGAFQGRPHFSIDALSNMATD